MNFITASLVALFSVSGWAMPAQPSAPEHPGSSSYSFEVRRADVTINGRKVEVFLPNSSTPVPVIVFGHGQAIDVTGYSLTFEHLAKKGVAVIHPQYDNGFFDRAWTRMADDFNQLTAAILEKYSSHLDPSQVIYSGHSKGAYVALMAAGAPTSAVKPAALVLFAPADLNSSYLGRLDRDVPLTIVWGEADTIIQKSVMTQIYNQAPSLRKQFIEVVSYPTRAADHYFPQNKKFIFGGHDGVSAYHYFGVWKWLLGAAWDVEKSGGATNPYLYGDESGTTGESGLEHRILRSW
jgi:acetyl esterase/lipase